MKTDNGPPTPWSRPVPEREGPIRNAGGFYRVAEGKGRGRVLGGVPLIAAEDALVAAVRMAYKVADAQIDRSARLAQRLRAAGDRVAGPHSDRRALDATEDIVFKAMMSGLSWLEGAAAERESPLKRLLEAQYKLLGSMLGLVASDNAPSPQRDERAEREPVETRPGAYADPSRKKGAAPTDVDIVYCGDVRPVMIRSWDLARAPAELDTNVRFYSVEHKGEPIAAEVSTSAGGPATLAIDTPAGAPPGLWRAAVCVETNQRGRPAQRQVGLIEIVL